jgi:hypothetical protein
MQMVCPLPVIGKVLIQDSHVTPGFDGYLTNVTINGQIGEKILKTGEGTLADKHKRCS